MIVNWAKSMSRLAGMMCLAWTVATVGAETSGQQLAEGAGQSLIGTLAPKVTLKTIDGQTIKLGELYGKQAVYLKFWATWCVPCREQMPHFERTYKTAGPDLAVIAIDTGFNDSIEDVVTYRRRMGITMPIVLDDGQSGAAFHLRVTPQHIVIGRDGRIQYVGHLADARLDAALLAARTAPASGPLVLGGSSGTPAVIRRYLAGDLLPAQSPLTIDEKRFSFRDSGQQYPTVLIFLSPWCESYLATTRPAISADCRRMRERVNALAREHNIRWLGIASGLWATATDLRDYRRKYDIRIPLSLDESGDLFRAFDVMQVPVALVADKEGRIVRRLGFRDFETLRALRAATGIP